METNIITRETDYLVKQTKKNYRLFKAKVTFLKQVTSSAFQTSFLEINSKIFKRSRNYLILLLACARTHARTHCGHSAYFHNPKNTSLRNWHLLVILLFDPKGDSTYPSRQLPAMQLRYNSPVLALHSWHTLKRKTGAAQLTQDCFS